MSNKDINNEYILSMDGITKIYPNGFVANDKVDFKVKKGEIHGLCGENGAGKSTLMKILFGEEAFDEGRIVYKGEEIKLGNSLEALELGIGMVHQHFMLVPSLTVAENLTLGLEPSKGPIFDFEEAVESTNAVSKKFNLPIDPLDIVDDLPVGFKQRLEILKILHRGVDILILDEPTAVLTPQETEELFKELKNLKDEGYTIIFISHKLHEIIDLCDRITVLRNGKVTGKAVVSEINEGIIAKMMVGRDVLMTIDKTKAVMKENVLEIKNISYKDKTDRQIVKDVSFSVKKGQILGIAGVEGNGQREISEMVTGLIQNFEGEILVSGQDVKPLSVREIRDLGVSHISEDRMTYGTVIDASIQDNMISDRVHKPEYSNKFGLLKEKVISKFIDERIVEYQVKCDSKHSNMSTLSGGNMQKVVVAREFSSDPTLIVANQPTRGIDVGTSEFVRNKLVSLRDEDKAVLLISADLTEVLEVSDSIVVMSNGKIAAYFDDSKLVNEEILGEYLLGLKTQTEAEIRRAYGE